MLDSLKSWIVGVAVSGILISLARVLMPEGSVKKGASVLFSAVLLLAVGSLLVQPKTLSLPSLNVLGGDVAFSSEKLEETNRRLTQEIIEERTEAYILDKAEKLGAAITPSVTAAYGEDGVCRPDRAVILGTCSPLVQQVLSEYMDEELGIPPENQIWRTE